MGVATAVAASGDPPAGLSPIAASVYRAQFGICSLDTLTGLAHQQGLAIATLSPDAAAARLATALDGDLGRAGVRGCRGGLLYRYRTDRTITALRNDLNVRISSEKYVAAAYMVVMLGFFAYVIIHAGKITRLQRETRELLRVAETLDPPPPSHLSFTS